MLVIAVHALLLLGLPHLSQNALPGSDAGTFITRLIAPPTAAPTAEPKPIAAPPPEPQLKQAPAPVRRPPEPRVKHKTEPAMTSLPTPAERALAPERALGGVAPAVSMFTPKPLGDFGGRTAPTPITPPIAANETASALEVAKEAGDAPIRIPRATDLSYQASGTIDGQEFTVTTPAQWRQDGQWYEIRWGFYSPKVGEQNRRSVGLITPQGLAPLRAESRTPDTQEIRFDYDTRKTWFSAAGAEALLVPGAEDRLSAVIQLGALLAGDPARYPVGSTLELPAAHIRGAGLWRFMVQASEDLPALHDKTVPTIHLVHAPLDPRDARIEVWLGPTLDYLPVRLRTTEPTGDHVEYNLVTAYAQPTPSSGAAPLRSP